MIISLVLERKMSTRKSREELIKRGVLKEVDENGIQMKHNRSVQYFLYYNAMTVSSDSVCCSCFLEEQTVKSELDRLAVTASETQATNGEGSGI